MHHPNIHSTYSQNVPHQQPQSYPTSRPFQQQFGPRFQTPPQNCTPSSTFCQPPRLHHGHPRPPYQSPINPRPLYQPDIGNFDQVSNSSYPPPVQNFQISPKPPYQLPVQNFETSPNPQYPPPHGLPGPSFRSPSIPQYRIPGPPLQNYNQPPIQNYNHPPIKNYNHNLPIPNYNQPPPIQNYDQPSTPPYLSVNQNSHQPMTSPPISLPFQHPNPGYSPSPNTQYQPRSPKSLNQSYQLPTDQCYQQQSPPFNLPRHEFNQRLPFKHQGQQRFPFKYQTPRYQQPLHDNNRYQFHPKQQYQNNYPRGPLPSFNNQTKDNNTSKNDKIQIACKLGDCDFVGHPGAVKEHQNMHHRLGLHKKVLYSNNSDAIKKWIEERKKKWPTKDNIQAKSETEDEKNKRGERIADDDFKRFNNKNNKFNISGPKRFDNRKRTRPNNADYIEPIEEPMNGNLKRFAGIVGIKKEKEEQIEEITKPKALKLIEEYVESSDDEPPEEITIIKESVLFDNQSLIKPEENISSISEIENNKIIDSTPIVENASIAVSIKVNIENGECKKSDSEHGQKRKKNSKNESRPIKKNTPMRTPRNEVMERKGALLEALMGDLMRSERNTITQCICYIRNNMDRFSNIQAA